MTRGRAQETLANSLGYLKLLVRNPSFEIQTFDKFHVEDGGDDKNCRSRKVGGFRQLHGVKNFTDLPALGGC